MKKCTRCWLIKPVSDYGRHESGKDGLRSRCKPCEVQKNTEYRKTANGRKALERYRSQERAKQMAKRSYDKWVRSVHGSRTKRIVESRYSDRRYARNAVAHALRQGRLERQPCFICGEKAQAHHPDYSRPLDVTWLCPEHHKAAHRAAAEILHAAGERETLRF